MGGCFWKRYQCAAEVKEKRKGECLEAERQKPRQSYSRMQEERQKPRLENSQPQEERQKPTVFSSPPAPSSPFSLKCKCNCGEERD
jgi:hypothetical protein